MQQKYIEANNAYIDLQTIPNDERLGTAEYLAMLICDIDISYEVIDEGCGIFRVKLYPDNILCKKLSEKLKKLDITYQNYPIMFDLSDHYDKIKELFALENQ